VADSKDSSEKIAEQIKQKNIAYDLEQKMKAKAGDDADTAILLKLKEKLENQKVDDLETLQKLHDI
jgi:hypothetical protein